MFNYLSLLNLNAYNDRPTLMLYWWWCSYKKFIYLLIISIHHQKLFFCLSFFVQLKIHKFYKTFTSLDTWFLQLFGRNVSLFIVCNFFFFFQSFSLYFTLNVYIFLNLSQGLSTIYLNKLHNKNINVWRKKNWKE